MLHRSMLRTVITALSIAMLSGPVSAETLRAGGVGAATNLLPRLFEAFNQKIDELDVIPGLGTSGGLRALEENVLDFAVAGRTINEEEKKRGLRIALEVRTPFVLATSHPNPNGVKAAEVSALYASPKATWADGSSLRIILRPKSDSDTPILSAMFAGMPSSMETARTRQDVLIAATDQDNASLGERVEGSLIASTLTQLQTEKRNVRVLPVDGVQPSVETLESGAYPYSKSLYFVLSSKENPAVDRFLAFLKSPAGKALLRETGNILVEKPGAS